MNSGLIRSLRIGGRTLANNLILAPVAGVSDLPFRSIAKAMGCGLVVTELVSSEGLVRAHQKTRRFLSSQEEEKPLSIQIFGHHPGPMAEAARLAEEAGADFVDINFGCPVRKVTRAGAGAGVMQDPARARAIMASMVKAVSIPVTMKMRIGMDERNLYALELAKMAEESGIAAIAVHARTVAQGFSGKADWEWIARVKSHVSVPVIGNGDIQTPEDAERLLIRTRCDGAMIGRAAFGNPWIFREVKTYLETGKRIPGPDLQERREVLLRHFNLVREFYGESQGTVLMRKQACWYTKGLDGGSEFRSEINRISDPKEFGDAVERFFDRVQAPDAPHEPAGLYRTTSTVK
jgi:tRNA-dihydrouridine synthase B